MHSSAINPVGNSSQSIAELAEFFNSIMPLCHDINDESLKGNQFAQIDEYLMELGTAYKQLKNPSCLHWWQLHL